MEYVISSSLMHQKIKKPQILTLCLLIGEGGFKISVHFQKKTKKQTKSTKKNPKQINNQKKPLKNQTKL